MKEADKRKAAEEILRKHIPPPKNEGEKNDDINIINAMIEYSQRLNEVSEEEMARACPQEYTPRLAAWMQGARWMRDRLQPVGKTDQLKGCPFDEEKTKG